MTNETATVIVDPQPLRECGSCHECCVHLGIEELHKYGGSTCRHLDASLPEKKCRIYNRRPTACITYSCMWRNGLIGEDGRPDKSGVLTTMYLVDGQTIASVHVTNTDKAGKALDEGFTYETTKHLLELGVAEIKMVLPSGAVFIYKEGKIHRGHLIPPEKGDYEGLSYEALLKPIGTYMVKDKEEV